MSLVQRVGDLHIVPSSAHIIKREVSFFMTVPPVYPMYPHYTVPPPVWQQKMRPAGRGTRRRAIKIPTALTGNRYFWWGMVDSNHRRRCQQIYSLSPLATREIPHMKFARVELVDGLEPPTC